MNFSTDMLSLQSGGRRFEYVYRPAAAPGAPLLLVLHGHNKDPQPSKYASPDWNVVCPVDRFGLNGYGSWFLGEQGDTFWLDAMQQIVASVRTEGQPLFTLGSSMGGYGAILHGMKLGAKAIYANIPQTHLLGSTYSDKQGMRRYFEAVLGSDGPDSPFNDLRNFTGDEDSPFIYLTGNRWDKDDYIEEQTLPLVTAMLRSGQPFTFELFPKVGHDLGRTTVDSAAILLRHFRGQTQVDGGAGSGQALAHQNGPSSSTEGAAGLLNGRRAPRRQPEAHPAGTMNAEVATLVRTLVESPEALWSGDKAHMASRQRLLIEKFAKRNRLKTALEVFEFVTDLALRRASDRPETFAIVNAGSSGSHWLQELVADAGHMNPCGEAYYPPGVNELAKRLDDADKGLLLDSINILHAYRPMTARVHGRLISTAHVRGWAQHAMMPGKNTLILLQRDPVDVAISRTFRKDKHRRQFFADDDDLSYLLRNIEYLQQFYKQAEKHRPDAVVRYEDLRRDSTAAIVKLSQDLGIALDPSRIDTDRSKQTNIYSGPVVAIPDALRAEATERLSDMRKALGYA